MSGKVDFSYQISDERLLAWAKKPLMEKLQMLDDIRRFTLAMRAAPVVSPSSPAPRNPSGSPHD
ncbi:MAG TPA: hypothetical protein PLW86_08945 [Rhodocyclaceae bacterium]|nr:hypothetical protein [Rhodocyclaceae bacterium]